MADAFHSGNEKDLMELRNIYYKPLCTFANRLIGDKDDAEDIVAQAFFDFWKSKKKFEKEHNAKAWLFISVRNRCLNHIRRVDEYRRYIKYVKHTENEQEWDNGTWNKYMEANVLKEILWMGVDNLPEECKRIFNMLYKERLSPKEVAAKLNISVETVRSQKSRGLKLLKAWVLSNELYVLFALLCWLEQYPENFF